MKPGPRSFLACFGLIGLHSRFGISLGHFPSWLWGRVKVQANSSTQRAEYLLQRWVQAFFFCCCNFFLFEFLYLEMSFFLGSLEQFCFLARLKKLLLLLCHMVLTRYMIWILWLTFYFMLLFFNGFIYFVLGFLSGAIKGQRWLILSAVHPNVWLWR